MKLSYLSTKETQMFLIWILEEPSLTHGAFQVVLVVKNLPANATDSGEWVWSLGQEDAMEGGQGPPVFLPGENYGWISLVGYSPRGSQRVRHDWSDLAQTYEPPHNLYKFVYLVPETEVEKASELTQDLVANTWIWEHSMATCET